MYKPNEKKKIAAAIEDFLGSKDLDEDEHDEMMDVWEEFR